MAKGYIYAEVAVLDALRYEGWRYRAVESIAAAGARFIVRRGNPEVLAGNKQVPLVFIIEFESRERAHEWWRAEHALMTYLGTAAELNVVLLTGEED
jgi:uncharacterized protein (DUF1330 family)